MSHHLPLSARERRLRWLAGFVGVVFAVLVFVGFLWTMQQGGDQSTSTGTSTSPPAIQKPFEIVFPEGFTRADMIARVQAVAQIAEHERHHKVRLSAVRYAAQTKQAVIPCFGHTLETNLEGFLFPSTYQFLTGTTSLHLVQDQVTAFCVNWRKVNLAYARSKNLTPHDVLTIASMIEAETAVPRERRLVAAVIYNRLRDRMPLGIDATLRYGLHIPPTQAITEKELQSHSPYNTRIVFGLPPTPIANPGLASIQAAAHPANVDYLYFVRVPGTRRNFFTASATAFDQYLATHGYGPHP